MAHLVLTDLPPALVAKLEERARSAGTTPAEVARGLLLRALEEDEVWTTGPDGLPLYVGPIAPADLDHRIAREERIDQIVRGFGGSSG